MNKAYRNRIFVLAATAALGSTGIIVPAGAATAGTTAHSRTEAASVVTAAALAQDIVGFNAKFLGSVGAKLAADIDAKVAASISVQASGLLDSQLSTELDAELHLAINASVAATFEAELGTAFSETLGTRVTAILESKCPSSGSAFADCVRLNTPAISQAVINLYVQAIAKVSANVAARLDANVDAAIALTIKNFEANLVLESVTVNGQATLDAQVKAQVAAALNLQATASVWTAALAELILTSA